MLFGTVEFEVPEGGPRRASRAQEREIRLEMQAWEPVVSSRLQKPRGGWACPGREEEGRREGWIEKERLLGKVGFTRKDPWSRHHRAVTLSKEDRALLMVCGSSVCLVSTAAPVRQVLFPPF